MYQRKRPRCSRRCRWTAADKPSKEGQPRRWRWRTRRCARATCATATRPWRITCLTIRASMRRRASKKIFFKNFMDARVNNVILPIAQTMLPPDQARAVSGEGYLTAVILHEISHGLGPAYAHVDGKQVRINEAIGPAYSGLEEAKADVTGIFLAKWLVDQRLLPAAELNGDLCLVCCGHLPHAALRHRRGARPRGDDGVQLPAGAACAYSRARTDATPSTTRRCRRPFGA